MPDPKKPYGDWEKVRELGKGGQSLVYLARHRSDLPDDTFLVRELKDAIYQLSSTSNSQLVLEKGQKILAVIRALVRESSLRLGALKVLLPLDQAVNAKDALERMAREVKVLEETQHPALIRILDANLPQKWFVTEYFPKGSLGHQIDSFRGNVLGALEAFREIVDAVKALHKKNIVHRDIKPENVFVRDSGGLVLGDCGLAIRLDNEDRLTSTYENVGTRDWMPGWAMGMRLEDVSPTFDVFSLGKLLWSMISGKPRLRLWYYNRAGSRLEEMFPSDPHINWVTSRILKKTIVEEESDCLPDASHLLAVVDAVIDVVSRDVELPLDVEKMKCRFCKMGTYEPFSQLTAGNFSDPHEKLHHYRCNYCGHLERFFWRGDELPPAWREP